MTATCPHCGAAISRAPSAIRAIVETLDMPRKERLAAEAILANAPRWTSKASLVASMYDDQGEDPGQPENGVQSHVSKLRRKLHVHGWTIESRRYDGYRFAPLVDPAKKSAVAPAYFGGAIGGSMATDQVIPAMLPAGEYVLPKPRASEHVEHSQA